MYNIEYQIVRTHPFKRTTTISISPEGGVVVRAPSWVPHREIERFVKLKSGWIKNSSIVFLILQNHKPKILFMGNITPFSVRNIHY
ncbi:DUF45 domain-containing protein [Candidatus Collierbacteria bacterium]|nr:DUF45 domain-containing protein [Candidatus Collierbacteria bacterium]